MEFDRHDRVRSNIKELAAKFVLEEANSDPLITITEVTISPDYRKATILFTTLPDDREDDALVFLTRHASTFRDYLKKHAALKYLPHIDFAVDRGERHRQHIDEVVRNIEDEN